MSNVFGNLVDNTEVKAEVDSVGSSGPLASGLMDLNITMAYAGKSKGGASSFTLHFGTEGGRDIRQTFWVSSGDAKGNSNMYTNAQGEKKYLPDYALCNNLCLLTLSKNLAELAFEQKQINIYNFEERKEVMTEVMVATELLGKQVLGGVLRVIEDKNVQDATGKYVPSGETRTSNQVDKFFRAADRLTAAEILAGVVTAEFADKWAAKWLDKDKDISTPNVTPPAGAGGQSAAFGTAAAAPKPVNSIFAQA